MALMAGFDKLLGEDPDLAGFIASEEVRQEGMISLIASENYADPLIMSLQGSVCTNKYAEGYPGKRYYGGCASVDDIERLAIKRACTLFGAAYANVQPHSGSQANAAVFMSLMEDGDTFLGMNLAEGGHLTHGAKVNFSGRLYHAIAYGLDESGDIDYDQVRSLAKAHRPKVIIAGFSAFSGVARWDEFRAIADEVDAYLLVDMAHVAGLIAAGLYPSPIPHAHVVTSTTHKTLRGARGGLILSANSDPDWHKKLNFGVFPGTQGGPLMHAVAAKAYSFKRAMSDEFKAYQKQVCFNAKTMATCFMDKGVNVVSSGTKNHMFLLNFIDHPWSGKVMERALERAHIIVNKNMVPGDSRSPFETSGLRIGTPAITTRGFGEEEVRLLADWTEAICAAPEDNALIERTKEKVKALCVQYPIYPTS
jgi:glycine hydroxymethyltransferase